MSIRYKDQPVRARRRGDGRWHEGIISRMLNAAAEYEVYFPFFDDNQWIGIEDLQREPLYSTRAIQNYRN